MDPSAKKLPPLWPWLLLCAVTAVMVSLGTFHRYHTSDTLMPVMVSLYRWTPFMWMQDRIGMLVPLLASPLSNPLYNLVFQTSLNVFGGLIAPFLLARYVLRDSSYPLVGSVAAAAYLVLTPANYRFNFFQVSYYGVWLGLAAGGLVLASTENGTPPARGRRLAALGLFILTHWLYIPAVALLGPLVVLRNVLMGPVRKPWQGEARTTLILLVSAFLVGCALIGVAHINPPGAINHVRFGILPPSTWPHACFALGATSWTHLQPPYWLWFLLAMTVLGLLLGLVPSLRSSTGHARRAAAVLVGAALVYWLVMGTQLWPSINDYDNRYVKPSLVLIGVGVTLLVLAPLGERVPRRYGAMYLLVAPTLLLAALVSYGRPSLDQVRADVGRYLYPYSTQLGVQEKYIAAIVDGRCTHIAGEYWKVWPLMFDANRVLYERGEQRAVWAVTHWSEPIRDQSAQVPLQDMRIAVRPEDLVEAKVFLKRFGFPPLEVVEKGPKLLILRPRDLVEKR